MRSCIPMLKFMDEAHIKTSYACYMYGDVFIMYNKYLKRRFVVDEKESDRDTVVLVEFKE
jgi:hypothetical protein